MWSVSPYGLKETLEFSLVDQLLLSYLRDLFLFCIAGLFISLSLREGNSMISSLNESGLFLVEPLLALALAVCCTSRTFPAVFQYIFTLSIYIYIYNAYQVCLLS